MNKTKLSKGRKGQKGRGLKYDVAFKRKVVKHYLSEDQSMNQLGVFYNIPCNYISRWMKEFSDELASEINIPSVTTEELKELELLKKQNEALKKKLEYEQMKNFALETLVDLAKEELGIDLRKNSGAKQPGE